MPSTRHNGKESRAVLFGWGTQFVEQAFRGLFLNVVVFVFLRRGLYSKNRRSRRRFFLMPYIVHHDVYQFRVWCLLTAETGDRRL
jgi:hypothetical protein